ncbi:leukocyte elastase inhibitor-like [Hyla sarda]|uniref:leukocyte elastase inhibitor-like n=1 Tax=Hyla sarda TaxID=327740 RepID=UPI0024C2ABC7|nr:leukocyte elastase inhibitor-like [Hyla sarda]
MDAASKAVFNFSCDLLKELMKTEQDKNIFFSPLGIATMLKMAMIGAGGNTKSEIEKVLHISEECPTKDCEGLPESIKKLLSNKTGKKYELQVVNGFFGEKSITFLDQYLQLLKKDFNAELNPTDFKHNAEAETQKINEWVKCVTNGKIIDLFAKGSFNESAVLALVNAMYFKGQWAIKFNPENTKEGIFNVNKNEKKTIQMMSHSGKFKHAVQPEIKCKILMLPYQEDLSLIIVLPDDIEGIHEVVPKLTPELLTTLAQPGNLKETDVDVQFPKFQLEGNYDLKSQLTELGMKEVFQENADFSGMSDAKGLVLSCVAHKCCIDVNEEGTEAAAATGGAISATSAYVPEPFIVDHPFMFCLVQNTDFLILFKGVVFSP